MPVLLDPSEAGAIHQDFTSLAQEVGGVIPVQYKRVPCTKQGGVRFTIVGNPWWQLFLVTNVGGGGDVQQLQVQGSGSWISASRSWGQNWQVTTQLSGQPLSITVTLGNGNSLTCSNVAGSNWGFGQTFECDTNF
jgi:expansin (peptidoglycan-binding protein)